MSVLFFGFGALAAAFIVQVLLVRCLQPRNHAAVIVAVFGTFSLLALLLFVVLQRGDVDGLPLWADTARLALMLGSLSLAYIAVYSAIEDDSPSMAMVKMAWQAGGRGCTEADFRTVMNDHLFLDQRIEAMKRDGWVVQSGDAIVLTPLGRIWGTVFSRAQQLLRMDEGG
ncbi:MAG: hypothetical protein WED15_10100 [Akkermansiaceae bacterium]